MNLQLESRSAWIVGASGAVGGAIAHSLAAAGMRVCLSGRNEDKLKILRDALRAKGLAAETATLNAPADYIRVAQRLITHGPGIDVLVNTTASPIFDQFEELDDEHWQEVFDAKLMTYVRSMRAAVPLMAHHGGGSVINISGRGGRQPSATHLAGGAMNAAVNLLTKGIADVYRTGRVRANVVSPGPILSPRLGALNDASARAQSEALPLAGRPEDVANVVAFLASPLSSHINGTVVGVDGGGLAAL